MSSHAAEKTQRDEMLLPLRSASNGAQGAPASL